METLMFTAFIGGTFTLLISFLILDIIIKIFVKNKERPSEITTLVILLGLGAFLQTLNLLRNSNNINFPQIILSLLGIIWLYGIWNMKKWGAVGFTASIIIGQLLLVLQNKLTIFSALLLLPIAILYYHASKMK